MIWSQEQIDRLAPDNASLQAAQKLADTSLWQVVGANELVVWGEYAGSARDPYRTLAGMAETSFHCTCPSRKHPCKHVLGLLLMVARHDRGLTGAVAPPWVNDWLANRTVKSGRKRLGPESGPNANLPHRTFPPPSDAHQKSSRKGRTTAREARVRAGIRLAERWLTDLVSQGFSAIDRSRGNKNEEAIASRLVDAQAPGLARRVRQIADTPGSCDEWPSVMLEQVAQLFLAVDSYQRIEGLSLETRADLHSVIGFTIRREEILKTVPVEDRWLVMGTRLDMEDRLHVRRMWLAGVRTQRIAAIVDYSMDELKDDPMMKPGTLIQADLHFYPGAYPWRAVMGKRKGKASSVVALPGRESIEQSLGDFARAIALNPWLDFFPISVKRVIPLADRGEWLVVDHRGEALPLAASEHVKCVLSALSGGQPIDLFGEWDGACLRPLTAVVDRRWVRF